MQFLAIIEGNFVILQRCIIQNYVRSGRGLHLRLVRRVKYALMLGLVSAARPFFSVVNYIAKLLFFFFSFLNTLSSLALSSFMKVNV